MTMTDLTASAMAVFRQHHQHATARMLSETGVGATRRRRLVDAGVLEIAHRGVYRLSSAPDTLAARCVGLCMAHPQGFITGPTGGTLIELRRMGRAPEVHLSVPHGSNIGPIEGVVLRQTTVIEPWHVVRRPDGITVASPPRLAFDLAADLSPQDHASVVEQLIHDRHCTAATMHRIGRRLARPGRPGSVLFVATLSRRLAGGPLESHPEVLLGQALRDRGVPVVAQVQGLRLPSGRRIRLDLAVPELRWGIEIDIHADHFLLEGGTSDRRRDRECHRIGWQIDRVTQFDLVDLDGLCDELVAVHDARRLAVAC
ncbi:MAG: hypothetical protein WD023_03700 [Ilumatobacteraceae bacterium]